MSISQQPEIVTGEDDASEVAAFVQQCHAGRWQPGMYHIGDLWWYRALALGGTIGVWRDDTGEIAGFAFLEEPDSAMMQIRPELRGQGDLEQAMMSWAARMQPEEMLWTRVIASDHATIDWLLRNSFVADPFSYILHRRAMTTPVPDDRPPHGFMVRHVLDYEFEERVLAHRDAFEPSKFTLEKYLRARGAPDYNPELDIVAVADDGTIAANCIAWYDTANHIGYFEPVGTRKAFQGRGLGRCVLHEALRRLQALGAHETIVATNATNQAARALYHAVGFGDVDEELLYGKRLRVTSIP